MVHALNFKQLSNTELNQKVKTLAEQERKLTREIIEHIAEVDRRKLFLDMAFSSLFEYLTEEIKYSAGAAQRRIDAARLSQRIPELTLKIEDGSLNFSHLSKVQKICRQIKSD